MLSPSVCVRKSVRGVNDVYVRWGWSFVSARNQWDLSGHNYNYVWPIVFMHVVCVYTHAYADVYIYIILFIYKLCIHMYIFITKG